MFLTWMFAVAIPTMATGYSPTGERSIRSSVLSSFAYDRMSRPATSTVAYVGFNLLAINDVNIENQEFVCTGWFTVLWNDDRLRWSPVIYDDTEYIHALEEEIWKPEVLVDNAIEGIELISDDHLIYRISYNGDVEWEPPVSEKVYCGIDVTYFPFDIQICTVEFVSWGLPKPELVLYKLWDDVNFKDYRQSGSWEILSASVNESDVIVFRRNTTKEIYSQIDITFTIKRNPGLFVLNTIIPTVTSSYLSLVTFIVPAGSGEKTTFAVGAMVVQAILMTLFFNQVPGASTSTSIFSQYLASTLCISAIVCVVSAIISQIHHQPPEMTISLIHRIIIFVLKKLTLWCDPPKVEVDLPLDEPEAVYHMATDDLKKIERNDSFIKRNVIAPEFSDGFTEKVQVKDVAVLSVLGDFKQTNQSSKAKQGKKQSKKIKQKLTYYKYNWDTVAKVWDRFFFVLGVVALTLFHVNFLNVFIYNGTSA